MSLNAIGIFFVFLGDMQKFTFLKFHPNELITDGLFKLSRNIKFYGEFLFYTAFALLTMMWVAFLPTGSIYFRLLDPEHDPQG